MSKSAPLPPNFCAAVESVVVDELDAVGQYSALAAQTTDPVEQMVLISVAGDEYGHARTFTALQQLCTDPPPDGFPAAFCDQIGGIIQDELGAVQTYTAFAAATTDRVLRMVFYNIAGDEYHHLQMFEALKELICT